MENHKTVLRKIFKMKMFKGDGRVQINVLVCGNLLLN